MNYTLEPIRITEKAEVLLLFKMAAKKIAKKKIDHWQYWENPPKEKIRWVEEGLANHEFFFIKSEIKQTIGMVRILEEDIPYWGQRFDKALYIHSLVVVEEYEGKGIGKLVIDKIEMNAIEEGFQYLRLDADANNPKLCDYYLEQGFIKVGEKKLPLSTYNLYEKKLTINATKR